MNIRPLADHVVLEPLKPEERTKSGIILPETGKERPEQGRVLAVGPGKKAEDGKVLAMDINVGDRVLFSKYGPNEVTLDDKEYLIAKQDDILAVLEE